MMELPEAVVISRQLKENIAGKKIRHIDTAHNPHKFAWYSGDPQQYASLLTGKVIETSTALGSWIDVKVEDAVLSFCEGINLRFHQKNEKHPDKHQLLIEFEDATALSASVQMYGGLYCYKDGQLENEYHRAAATKPSPLSDNFDVSYFLGLAAKPGADKLSSKALLATEQRIPGLGNGVLQDILYNARINPKRKTENLSENELQSLFESLKSTLREMALLGGRDTEKDLFGHQGGYTTRVSKNTAGKPCPACGSIILKESYMGGSIYYCPGCQK
jgi:formamidopyrimidine-DNA glycosylase